MIATLVRVIQGSAFIPRGGRAKLLKIAGFKIGRTTRIYEGCLLGSRDIVIGSRVFINARCYFDSSARITIGDDVHFGPQCALYTSTHEIGPATRRGGPVIAQPVEIGAGCWLGGGVSVMPGVSIAPGCIVAGGAVVTKSTEPNGLYAGVPAQRIKDLPA